MITQPKPRTAKLGLCGLLAIAVTAAVLLPMARGKTQVEKSQFIVRLSNGVTVELVGVCNWPDGKPVCWKPDGSRLDQSLRASRRNLRPGAEDYGYMLKVTGAADFSLDWKIDGTTHSQGSCDVVDAQGNRLERHTSIIASMSEPPEQVDLRLGFAPGPWSTRWTHDGSRTRVEGGDAGGVLWSQAFEDSDGTHIVAATRSDDNSVKRVVAIDREGAVIPASQSGGGSVTDMVQLAVTFPGLKWEDIREFQLQVRPYQWAQFNNVSLRPGQKSSVTVEPRAANAEMQGVDAGLGAPSRDHSRTQLSALGRALLIYAYDHDDKLPETLAEVQDEIDQVRGLSPTWVRENVAYLGRGMTTSNEPDDPVAYDKTLYEMGAGTNVLHLDTSVAFESPERLEELGIGPDKPSPAALRDSARRLRALGRSLVIYAKDHDDTFPAALEILPSGRTPDDARDRILQELMAVYGPRYAGRTVSEWEISAWELARCREHVQYLGKGVKANDDPARVLAYDKTLLAEGKGTNVLYVDARVEFVSPERCKELMPSATSAVSPEARAESATRLKDLGKAILFYAVKHDDKLPDELIDVRPEFGVGFSWLYDNVEYLGRGMTTQDNPERPIAYDKTLIQGGAGTNVLYLDTHVAFESPARLEELGIRYEPKPKSAEELRQEAEMQSRVTVLSHLKQVALAAHLYASENDGVFPDNLATLEPYLARDRTAWAWIRENVEYTGKGLNPANVREPSSKPIAYSRLASEQAVIAFVDGHVEYVIGPRLKELGIEIQPGRDR